MSPKSRGRTRRPRSGPRRPTPPPAAHQPSTRTAATTRGGATPTAPAGARIGDIIPVLPVAPGSDYAVLQAHPQRPVLRTMLGVVLAVSAYLVAIQLVTTTVLGISFLITAPGIDQTAYRESALAGERPEGLLATNLAIGSFIVICWLLMRWVNLVPPGFLASVVGRLRWSFVLQAAGLALVVFLAVQALGFWLGGTVLTPQPGFWLFLVVIILTTPVQAAAEEVFFRGYLLQSVGSAARRWWVGVIASSLLFALAHGSQSPALFVNRLAFGLLAGLLVWRTGGLEAAIGTHVINNVLAFTLAGLTGTIAQARAISEIGWDKAAIDIATFTVIAAGCWGIAHLRRLARHTTTAGSAATTR